MKYEIGDIVVPDRYLYDKDDHKFAYDRPGWVNPMDRLCGKCCKVVDVTGEDVGDYRINLKYGCESWWFSNHWVRKYVEDEIDDDFVLPDIGELF